MANLPDELDAHAVEALMRQTGLAGFLDQVGMLQTTLETVSKGMSALGDAAVRQRQDAENMAAHLIALEAVLSVVLRQIPVDRSEVRDEVVRRTENFRGPDGAGSDIVRRLADDILRRAAED